MKHDKYTDACMYNTHQTCSKIAVTLETPSLYNCEGVADSHDYGNFLFSAKKSIDFQSLSKTSPRLYHDLPQVTTTISCHRLFNMVGRHAGHAEVLITSEPVYLGTNQSWCVPLYGRSKEEWYQDWPDTSRYHLHLESRVCEICILFLKRTSNENTTKSSWIFLWMGSPKLTLSY